MKRERFTLSASVFVVVIRAERVLLLRRSGTGWKDGEYSLPAGGHDGNETIQQAAARELEEETALKVDPHLLSLRHTLHCQSGDSGHEWLGFFFVAAHTDGAARISEPDKHDALDWFPLSRLPENTVLYVRQALERMGDGETFSTFGWPTVDGQSTF
jgi:8-oxo-dGTP pyrophosphatase MutT (NUDIX family)